MNAHQGTVMSLEYLCNSCIVPIVLHRIWTGSGTNASSIFLPVKASVTPPTLLHVRC